MEHHNDDEEDFIESDEGIEVVEIDPEDPHAQLVTDLGEVGMDDDDDDLEEEGDEGDDIAEEVEDNSVFTIEKHEKSVFCIDLYNSYLASGGEDDIAYIWQLNNDNSEEPATLYLETEKFKDSIISVKFSADGKYLAVADMSGTIRVYDVEQKLLHWSHDLELDVEVLLWHFGCNVLFVGTGDSYLWMLKLSTNEIKMMGSGEAEVRVNNALILKDGKRAVCAYSNGTLTFWDLKTSQPAHNFKGIHGESEILSLDTNRDGTLVACGGYALKISLVNTNTYKVINELEIGGDLRDKNENCIETLSFCPLMPLLACATVNGEVFVWDLQTYTLRNKIINDFNFGFTKSLWSQSAYNLYLSGINGCVYELDGRNLAQQRKFSGHLGDVLDIQMSKDEKYLFTASDDHKIKIFQLSE